MITCLWKTFRQDSKIYIVSEIDSGETAFIGPRSTPMVGIDLSEATYRCARMLLVCIVTFLYVALRTHS